MLILRSIGRPDIKLLRQLKILIFYQYGIGKKLGIGNTQFFNFLDTFLSITFENQMVP